MQVDFVLIPPGSVALPDFDERMWHGPSVFIEHPPTDDNALAQRLPRMLFGQIERFYIDVFNPKHRAGNFRKRVWNHNQRFRRRALDRRDIRRMQVVRLRPRERAPESLEIHHRNLILASLLVRLKQAPRTTVPGTTKAGP